MFRALLVFILALLVFVNKLFAVNTDTIPLKYHSDKIKVVSVAPLFARAIRNVHEHGSISSLFKQVFAHQTKIELK